MKVSELLVDKHLGYAIYLDSEGFYINGMNGLGQPKKIVFSELSALRNWIDEQFNAYLGR